MINIKYPALMLFLFSACAPSVYRHHTTTLPPGRACVGRVPVSIAVTQRHLSSNLRGSAAIDPYVAEDVFADGRLLLRAGTHVQANHTVITPGAPGLAGGIRITPVWAAAYGGRPVAFEGEIFVRGRNRTPGTILMSLILPGWFLWLRRRGTHARIFAGQTFTVFTADCPQRRGLGL